MLLRPTPIQQPKIPLQIWPRPLRVAVLCGCPACWTWTLSVSDCRVSEPAYRTRLFLGLGRPLRLAAFRKKNSGLDAGDLPDDVDPLRSSINVWPLRPAYSAALEATPSLPSATARVSPLRAPPVSLAPCQPRAAVPESENSTYDLFPAPRSVDGVALHVTLQFLPHMPRLIRYLLYMLRLI